MNKLINKLVIAVMVNRMKKAEFLFSKDARNCEDLYKFLALFGTRHVNLNFKTNLM